MVLNLPEGLLKTNPEIYSALARHPVIPTEDMIQCSNVYATLHQKFDDSTSARANNFWRRVEGQKLSGPAIAKLFSEFLSSQTFDPLKRIKSQDDEALAPQNSQQEGPGEVDSTHTEQPNQGESLASSLSTTNTKSSTPLSSLSTPPRSILKRNQASLISEVQHAEPAPKPADQPTDAMLELEAQRAAELAAQRAAQIAADLEAELANQPTPSQVPPHTQVQVGFCPPVQSSSTAKTSLLSTSSPEIIERTAALAVASSASAYGGEPPTPSDAFSQRRVSFLDTLPGTSPPSQSIRDTFDSGATSSTTPPQYTIPMDRFGPRVGYVPQRVERSDLLLTGRIVTGSAPT